MGLVCLASGIVINFLPQTWHTKSTIFHSCVLALLCNVQIVPLLCVCFVELFSTGDAAEGRALLVPSQISGLDALV